jgi:hypothetical protein
MLFLHSSQGAFSVGRRCGIPTLLFSEGEKQFHPFPRIAGTASVGSKSEGGKLVMDWGKAFQVAFVGLSGVFVGLILLEICVNLLAGIVRLIERGSNSTK